MFQLTRKRLKYVSGVLMCKVLQNGIFQRETHRSVIAGKMRTGAHQNTFDENVFYIHMPWTVFPFEFWIHYRGLKGMHGFPGTDILTMFPLLQNINKEMWLLNFFGCACTPFRTGQVICLLIKGFSQPPSPLQGILQSRDPVALDHFRIFTRTKIRRIMR